MSINFKFMVIVSKIKKNLAILIWVILALMQITCGGGGGSSSICGQAPNAPKEIIVKPGNGEVLIKWNDISNAISYNIYYSTTPKVTKISGTKITNVKSPFSHIKLTNGITYYYVITAVNSIGESPESELVSATPSETITNKYVGATINDYLAKRI